MGSIDLLTAQTVRAQAPLVLPAEHHGRRGSRDDLSHGRTTCGVAGGAQARSARFQMIMSKPGAGLPAGPPDRAWRPGLPRVSAVFQRRFKAAA